MDWDAALREGFAGTPLSAIPAASVAALIAGTLLPLLGVWVVYQRIVFLGVTLAQVAAAGVALGLLLDLPPLPMGFLLCAGMVAVVVRGLRGGVGSGGDSALGAAFCVASALALLFISRSPAELEEIEHVLHGNLIYALPGDIERVSLALLAGLAVIGLCFKQVLFSAFDGETAAALGLRPRAWLLLLFVVLAVVLTLSMSTTGSLLTSALLILPPLAALQFRRGLGATFALAALLGFLATLGGLLLAVTADLHLESSIVVTAFLLLPLVACWRISPLLALALVAALAFLAPLLAPQTAPAVAHPPPHAPLSQPTPGPRAAPDSLGATAAAGTPVPEPASDLPPDVVALLAEAEAGGAGSSAAQSAAAPASAASAEGAAPPHHLAQLEVHLFAQPVLAQPPRAEAPTADTLSPADTAAAEAAAAGSAAAASGASSAASPASASPAAGSGSGSETSPAVAPLLASVTAIEVSWTLDLRRGVPPQPLPRALWLRTVGCGVSDERVLVRDTSQLPAGDLVRTGGFLLTGITSLGPIAGQLWTGPAGDAAATPVPDSVVYPSTAPGAHGHH